MMDDSESESSGTYNPAYTPLQEYSDIHYDGGLYDGIEGATVGSVFKTETSKGNHAYR